MAQPDSKMVDPGEIEKPPIYNGQGTDEDPYIVEFHKDESDNPMNWSLFRKWLITTIVTLSVFAVTFTSSAYSDSANEVIRDFNISTEVFILGVSLFVLGFAIGPAVWGFLVSTANPRPSTPTLQLTPPSNLSTPISSTPTNTLRSELYGRQILWLTSHIAMIAFIGGSAGSQNITTLLILRLLAGTFGVSPLVNSGGTIADLFPRGPAWPRANPLLRGPLPRTGRIYAIFLFLIAILGVIFVPETYGPVLLAHRASHLTQTTKKLHISILEKRQGGRKNPSEVFLRALIRPWVLLFREPIVLVASLYMAIIYGTVYMFMGAMPIVYNEDRGWSEGIGGGYAEDAGGEIKNAGTQIIYLIIANFNSTLLQDVGWMASIILKKDDMGGNTSLFTTSIPTILEPIIWSMVQASGFRQAFFFICGSQQFLEFSLEIFQKTRS
ncbi:MFS general substrate transporter [Aspergillus ellipticus CBS 707.79]|uniref:MFS general substrate transporter n=1 Tax=Aspergillus ellipticus CBS 707.79 TaxID=1448320 RepID=A0A319D065_9EURO|nr:MFS general substrate transporter [Aspergillus ellipticus CBS 707.79]